MAQPVDVKVGQVIRLLRLQRNISQFDLAANIGVGYQQIQRYERGQNRVSASRLVKIADALGADVRDFFEDPKPDCEIPINDNFLPKALMTRQGLELMRAFHTIESAHIRATVLDLVKSLVADGSSLDIFDSLIEDIVVG
jgi:transcriptional regulator with XRE-family HTH domain